MVTVADGPYVGRSAPGNRDLDELASKAHVRENASLRHAARQEEVEALEEDVRTQS